MDELRWWERPWWTRLQQAGRASLGVCLACCMTAVELRREHVEPHIHIETGFLPTTIDLGSPIIVTGAGRLY